MTGHRCVTSALVCCVGFLSVGPASAAEVDYPDFAAPQNLTRTQAAVFVKDDANRSVLRLTRSVSPGVSVEGAAFHSTRLTLASGFSTFFVFRLHDGQSLPNTVDVDGFPGADGFTFCVQNDFLTAVGPGGGGLGYGTADGNNLIIPNPPNIRKSLAVEFDAYARNVVDLIKSDHVGIDINGNVTSVASASIGGPSLNLYDGVVRYVWIDYDGDAIEVRVASSNLRPATPLLRYENVDLETIFGSSTSAFAGFTSGTNTGTANHDILEWRIRDGYDPFGAQQPPVPSISVSPSSSVAVGTSVTLDGTGSSDDQTPAASLAYAWRIVSAPLASAAALSSPAAAVTTLTPDRPGAYQVELQVTDQGGLSATATTTLTAAKAAQTIAFADLASRTYGDPSFNLGATASSGLAVSFSVLSGPATLAANGVLTLTGAGTVTVRASQAGNDVYDAAPPVDRSFAVDKATPTLSATGGTFVYDGAPHGATGSVAGVGGENLGVPTFSAAPIDAGTHDVTASYAGSANYLSASTTVTIVIGKATPTLNAAGGTFVYDGMPHAATGSVAGVAGEDLGAPDFSAAPIDAGTWDVTASYPGSANYLSASATVTIIIEKATAALNVTGGTFVYDGAPHGATGSVIGVAGEDLGAPDFTPAPIDAGTWDVIASYAGSANYLPTSTTVTIVIGKATPAVHVTGGTFVYDGLPHAATGSVSGVAGESLGAPDFTYDGSSAAPVEAGTYTVVASFAGNANYDAASNASATIEIVHSWSGALPPINQDGSSIFKLGSTIPVKFRLVGPSAAFAGLPARIFLAKLSDGIMGTWEAASSTSNGDSGNTFRFDAVAGQYIFNLSTRGLTTGTYQLRIDLDDGNQAHTVQISLR
jgi:legume-like lectin family protein/K319-like protein/MBG domain-containing protein